MLGALGGCGFFGFAGALGFEVVFAGALEIVELVTLFVDIIDDMHNYWEDLVKINL